MEPAHLLKSKSQDDYDINAKLFSLLEDTKNLFSRLALEYF